MRARNEKFFPEQYSPRLGDYTPRWGKLAKVAVEAGKLSESGKHDIENYADSVMEEQSDTDIFVNIKQMRLGLDTLGQVLVESGERPDVVQAICDQISSDIDNYEHSIRSSIPGEM